MVDPYCTPQVFDGRWGAYDHIGNEWVSMEALGDGRVSINTIVTDHTHNNQPHLYTRRVECY